MKMSVTTGSVTRKLCDWHSATVFLDSLGKYQARFAKRQMNNAMNTYIRRAALVLTLPVVLDLMNKCLSADQSRGLGEALTNWYRHQDLTATHVSAEERALFDQA